MAFLEIFKQFLPSILELVQFLFTANDKEFEKISESWPAPIKTSFAKARFEAKLIEKFPDEGDSQ